MIYGDPNCKVAAVDLSHVPLSFPSGETDKPSHPSMFMPHAAEENMRHVWQDNVRN